jgi:hypothetical protein
MRGNCKKHYTTNTFEPSGAIPLVFLIGYLTTMMMMMMVNFATTFIF